ncbi:PREDICTED: craniofacial development protein 2-like [Nicotiana attenuata]|uniref:craniofacial development protein 2-like n=1 Tax=Nicotiana attenuata TaxID=49451 RepID=UPI00090536C4|nr:PREDICTED: craniofacial development protein 2-like [Nicotiana attenuata]
MVKKPLPDPTPAGDSATPATTSSNRLGPVAISGERDVSVQTLKNNLRKCQQGAGGVGRERARWTQHRRAYLDNSQRGKNGVGILVDRDLRESVVEVRRVNDRLMIIKLVVGECTLNIVSAYATHAGLDEEVKRRFWEGLDEIVRQVPPAEKLFIGGDFNGHIGSTAGGYGEVHRGFGFGERNGGGTSLLDFAKAFGLVIANVRFPKREEHLVIFQNAVAKTQIDYLLLRRYDRGLCEDCKVIPGEILAMQHRLLVMYVGIMLKRRKWSARGRPRIRWGALTKDKAKELEGRLSAMGAWRSSGDARTMWSATTDCIRRLREWC